MSDTTISRMPLDSKAWHRGYVAGRRDLTTDSNPYFVGTAEAQAWQLGRSVGRMKLLRPETVND